MHYRTSPVTCNCESLTQTGAACRSTLFFSRVDARLGDPIGVFSRSKAARQEFLERESWLRLAREERRTHTSGRDSAGRKEVLTLCKCSLGASSNLRALANYL